MITKIRIENFKKFESVDIALDKNIVLFVGQNNGGKTTALQALSLWSFLVQQWRTRKGQGKAKERTGAPISRNEVYAAPIRDMKMLWRDGSVQGEKSKKIKIQIIAYGKDDKGDDWKYGMEVIYANPESCYCKPLDYQMAIPLEADRVFHLPPLSGVQTSEKRIDLGAQLRAIGEGRPGEILRNLLLQLQEKSPESWEKLGNKVKQLFGLELQPIKYNSQVDPDIAVYYRPVSQGEDRNKLMLEIANAGSGFLQFLLLAAFLYVHENAVLLLDEPDSHMHVFLQRGMYDWIQSVAKENNSQLIVSTHSEELVNSTDVTKITTFFSDKPHQLKVDRRDLTRAMAGLSALQVINVGFQKRVLMAEGDTDLRILKEWANVLKHPVSGFLNNLYFYPLETNHIKEGMKHFKALAVVEPKVKAFCLRDKTTRTENIPAGFTVHYWQRAEIENYLIHKDVLTRFARETTVGELFQSPMESKAMKYLEDSLPRKTLKDPLTEPIAEKGSDFLEKFFVHLNMEIRKSDYWQIAKMMSPEEIPDEVKGLFDKLSKFFS